MVVYTIEQCWEILRQIDLQKMPILAKKKKIIFSDEAHFDLGGCIHTYIIGLYNPSVRIIDLVSHTTYVVCVNFYT